MTETEAEHIFEVFFNKEKNELDLEYLNQFITKAVQGLIREYGYDELKAVLLDQSKENQGIDNDLSLLIELGCLVILFHQGRASSNLTEVQDRLTAILYFLNRTLAQVLIQNGLLNNKATTLYSYSDLLTLFARSINLFMSWCYNQSTRSLLDNAQAQVYSNSLRISYLLLPQ